MTCKGWGITLTAQAEGAEVGVPLAWSSDRRAKVAHTEGNWTLGENWKAESGNENDLDSTRCIQTSEGKDLRRERVGFPLS